MPLPNFLIIGAQKAGTTWLAAMLRQHPDVFIAERELHYFDKVQNFTRGIGWYERQFEGAAGKKAIGEKTPDYLWANGQGVEGHLPDVHRNLHTALPHAQLIVVLRNPVERAISAANHIIHSGRVSPLLPIDDLLVGSQRHLIAGHGVIEYGYYYQQIMAYREFFDPRQILTLIFEEDIAANPDSALVQTCDFLQIDPSYAFVNKRERVNEQQSSQYALLAAYYTPFSRRMIRRIDRALALAPAKARPSAATRHQLYQLYAEENEKLFTLLGRRIGSWEGN